MPEMRFRYQLSDTLGTDALSRTQVGSLRDERGYEHVVHVRFAPLPPLTEELIASFEADARAAASLSHDGIVPMLEHGVLDGVPYVVCPALEGKTLRELLSHAQGGRLPPALVAAIGLDLLGALAHAHGGEPPVVHRALSPEAVVVDAEGTARIADFALSATVVSAASTYSQLLSHTCKYSAPEQVKNQPPTPPTDVFSLGATLYEALAGRPPFLAATPLATVLKISMGAHDHLDETAPSAPAELRDAITAMLAAPVEQRPSARALLATFTDIVARERPRRADLGALVRPALAAPSGPPTASELLAYDDVEGDDTSWDPSPPTAAAEPLLHPPPRPVEDPSDALADLPGEPTMWDSKPAPHEPPLERTKELPMPPEPVAPSAPLPRHVAPRTSAAPSERSAPSRTQRVDEAWPLAMWLAIGGGAVGVVVLAALLAVWLAG